MDEPIEEPAAGAPVVLAREQRVAFYGDNLPAGQLADGTILVPLRPICEALGLDWSAQRRRLLRDPVLASERGVAVMATPTGPQEMVILPLRVLPGWLFGVSAARVRPELRAKILRYQRECYEVLWSAFKGEILPTPPLPAGAGELSGAALAYEIATAIQTLARQQMEIEARLGDMAGRQEALTAFLRPFVAETRSRLTALELQLSAGATISEAQAAELALAVKNVAYLLTTRGDRNGYQTVYGQMYRRYRISSYKNLPAARYDEVTAWLSGWYEELGGGRDT